MSSKALATGDPFSFAFRIPPAGFGAFGLSRLAPIPHVPPSYSGPDEIPLRSARLDCIKDQYKSESSSSLTFCNFSRSVCRFIRKMTRRPPLCPGAFRQGGGADTGNGTKTGWGSEWNNDHQLLAQAFWYSCLIFHRSIDLPGSSP